MLSNLLRRICCGAPAEPRNSGDVVAGLGVDNQQHSSEVTGNRAVTVVGRLSVISRQGDAAANGLDSSSPRTRNQSIPKDPSSKLDEHTRPIAAASSSSFIEPHRPFMAAALPVVALGAQLQGGSQPTRVGIDAGGISVVPQTLLCGAGSGIQRMPRHVASITSADMQLSASLSEPLVHSSSPGSGPPDPHQCSSSMGTAVTAISGVEVSTATLLVGGTATRVHSSITPLQHPVWTTSAASALESGSAMAVQASGSAATIAAGSAVPISSSSPSAVAAIAIETANNANTGRAADRRMSAAGLTSLAGLGARERVWPLQGLLTVERSGGSRLGRLELAVLGAAAGGSAALLVPSSADTEAHTGDEAEGIAAVATAVPAGAGVSTGKAHAATGLAHAASGNIHPVSGAATSANTCGEVVTPVGSQSSVGTGGGGTRGTGAFGMLSDITRRLLHMVQDVGSVVSQVALMPATASRADSTARPETVAVAVVDAAADAVVPNDGGAMVCNVQSPGYQKACEEHGAFPSQQSRAAKLQPLPLVQDPLNARQVHMEQLQLQQHDQQQQRQQHGASRQLVQPRSMYGQPAPAKLAAVGSGPYISSKGSTSAGNSSNSAMVRRGLDDIAVVQVLPQHPPYRRYPWGTGASTSRLPKHAVRDVSQVAMMQMLHFGSTSGRVPLQHLATLNVMSLSREIRALHWIGQGGGGAVFQGVWQGASVAVKFMLAARPEHVDATALEAIVSLAVGHPNVVTTYSFDVTRLTEASFMHDAAAVAQSRLSQQPAADGEDSSATALYNALMETETTVEMPGLAVGGGGGAVAVQRHRQHGASASAAAAAAGGGGGSSRPGSMHRVENLSTRLRRAQAAAALAGTTSVTTPSGEEAVEGMVAVSADGGSPGQEPDRGCTVAGGRPAGSETAARAPLPTQLQRSNAAAAPYAEPLGIESIFNSEEGFGDPDLADNGKSWNVRHVLTYLKARPGMYMTHIIMEYCDRGSLMSAIKRGIFQMGGLQDDDGSPGSGGGGSNGGSAAAAATVAEGTGTAVGLPEPLKFTKRVVLRALLRTARDIAQGMCHLHSNGIIHGDLKPGNVLLRGCRSDRRGFTALVSDFGLSKVTRSDKPLELNHWSTVTVMAPEVIMGRWLKASDVFSFGILLWQLVTGEIMPYGNSTVQQVLMGVAQGTLKPDWPASAHPAIVRLGRACLATSPEKRPSFEAIVKILTKIEQHVRNERRPPREMVDLTVEGGGFNRGRRHSRSSGSENATIHLKGSRSSAM